MVVAPDRKPIAKKVFFGWWVVLATGFVTFWGHGFYTQGFSALFKPISSDLGLSRAVTSVAASIGRFEGGIEGPITGWFTDKFGPRWVILFGTFLMGLGLILMNFVNSLWSFYLVWGGLVGTGLNVGLSIPIDKAIANWFVKKRGLALSVRAIMQGLATIAVLPMIAWLLTLTGWRTACFVGGLVMLAVGLPLVWFLIRDQRPEYYGLMPDGEAAQGASADRNEMMRVGVRYAAQVGEYEFSLRQALKTKAFWFLAMAFAAHNLVMSPLMVHFMPFLTDMGIAPVRAALMMSMASAVAIPTRLLGGWLADRAGKQRMRWVVVGAFIVIAIGIGVYQAVGTAAAAFAMLIIFYMGFTAVIPLNTAVRVRYFGRKSVGSIQGISALIMMPFGVIAPVYVGWIFDRTGNYTTAFNVFILLLVLAASIMAFARPPRTPERSEERAGSQ
jgi:sugar phosphate permease